MIIIYSILVIKQAAVNFEQHKVHACVCDSKILAAKHTAIIMKFLHTAFVLGNGQELTCQLRST